MSAFVVCSYLSDQINLHLNLSKSKNDFNNHNKTNRNENFHLYFDWCNISTVNVIIVRQRVKQNMHPQCYLYFVLSSVPVTFSMSRAGRSNSSSVLTISKSLRFCLEEYSS